MVAAEVTADQRTPIERDARVKAAAAWAWYQRHGGSIAPGSGRSEAFATRCSARPTSSRFQREAAIHARIQASQVSSDAAITSSSSMDKLSGSSSSLSHCTFDNVYGDAMDTRDETTMNDTILHPDQEADGSSLFKEPSLDIVSVDPAACWDCGSSLFDSFELVAMSKKLDAELHEPTIDGHEQEDVQTASGNLGLGFDLNQQKVLSLCDTPHIDVVSSLNSPPLTESHDAYDIFGKLISSPTKQSKQAVYDMFCHYGDAAKHVAKQTCKRSSPQADTTSCGGDHHPSRKQKQKPGRMSFHGLAKALHSITHLHSHHAHGRSDDAETVEDHHHHHYHHRHHNPHSQVSGGKLAMQSPGKGPSASAELIAAYDDVIEGPGQPHIHHHHHHHYHYLFHSDDDFRLQPLDKSLMVAAAGLRSSKASVPALPSYLGSSPARGEFPGDFGRKWAEFGSMPSPNFQC